MIATAFALALAFAQEVQVPTPPTPQPLLPTVEATPDHCNAAAAMVVPVLPTYPASTKDIRTPLTIDITVSLDEKGAVTDAQVEHSSGRDDVDAAALAAARTSTYTAQTDHCAPVASTYHYTTHFTPPSARG